MSLQIQGQSQSVDTSVELKSSSSQATGGTSADSASGATETSVTSSDTATISAAGSQLSGEVSPRQERVQTLRAQVESGTYTVDARAVATAMFQNLFRS
jgi:flagellar biosynthesis anti-sigma factor FlgM